MSKVCLPCRFSTILLYRGLIFNALQQPARGQRDLRAAQEMGATGVVKTYRKCGWKKTAPFRGKTCISGWLFQIFFILTPTWGNDPI